MTVQLMDETTFVNVFVSELAKQLHKYRQMCSYYVFGDKRPASVTENFMADARQFSDFQRLFQI